MSYLAPIVVLLCAIGVFSEKASPFDLYVMAGAGVAGYLLRRFGYDIAPALLALVLGDRMESAFRSALTISAGDYGIFFAGTAARIFLGIFAVIVVVTIVSKIWAARRMRAAR
jgi:putative tricarboxylic transport membrane protein